MEIKYTYGNTPAAIYLERVIAGESAATKRSVGQSISNTKRQVKELLECFKNWHMNAKTVANMLRLMREDVCRSRKEDLISMLSSNVQIGHIKRAIRLMSEQRKRESFMNKTKTINSLDIQFERIGKRTYSTKTINVNGINVGAIVKHDQYDNPFRVVYNVDTSSVDKTADELMVKSLKRLKRLGKHQ